MNTMIGKTIWMTGRGRCKSIYHMHLDNDLCTLYKIHPTCLMTRYAQYIPKSHGICKLCILQREKEYLKAIPEEDLPLYISHEWVFYENTLLYKKRMGDMIQ